MSGKYWCFSYSPNEKGLFCAPCVLFVSASARGISLNRLVTSPLQNYCHLTGRDGYLTSYLTKNYHEGSCYEATPFEKVAAGIETSTYGQVNHGAKRAKQKNRAILEQILEAIAFLGRCGLPF